jgi:hypothetical protein
MEATMAARKYMCAVPWVQRGGFYVGLRFDTHLKYPNDSPTEIPSNMQGGSQ